MNKPLDIGDRWWGYRWLYLLPKGRVLHRVAVVRLDLLERDACAMGATVCGYQGDLWVPGIMSRMGAPRCARCCAGVGIPRGDGAPFNNNGRRGAHQLTDEQRAA